MIAASSGPLEPEPEEVTFKASLFTPSWGEGPLVSSGAIRLLLLIPADPLQPRGGEWAAKDCSAEERNSEASPGDVM